MRAGQRGSALACGGVRLCCCCVRLLPLLLLLLPLLLARPTSTTSPALPPVPLLPVPRSDPAMPTLAVASALQHKHSDGVLDYAGL